MPPPDGKTRRPPPPLRTRGASRGATALHRVHLVGAAFWGPVTGASRHGLEAILAGRVQPCAREGLHRGLTAALTPAAARFGSAPGATRLRQRVGHRVRAGRPFVTIRSSTQERCGCSWPRASVGGLAPTQRSSPDEPRSSGLKAPRPTRHHAGQCRTSITPGASGLPLSAAAAAGTQRRRGSPSSLSGLSPGARGRPRRGAPPARHPWRRHTSERPAGTSEGLASLSGGYATSAGAPSTRPVCWLSS